VYDAESPIPTFFIVPCRGCSKAPRTQPLEQTQKLIYLLKHPPSSFAGYPLSHHWNKLIVKSRGNQL
jgi:hypothetical protein